MNSWTQENPHTNSRLLCVNLLAQQSQDTSSCPGGIAVEVDVVDSEISKPVGNSKVVVLQSKALHGTSITEGVTDGNGRLSLVLEQSGKYLVQVAGLSLFHLFRLKRLGLLGLKGNWRQSALHNPPALIVLTISPFHFSSPTMTTRSMSR